MTDTTTIEINVDTFSEGGSYSSGRKRMPDGLASGPFADPQTAQS
jgi:hypothetical protein